MFCDELAWDKPQCEINQPWNNDNVVQVAKHWNKVGNQIERHAEIAYGETQKYLGGKGSSRVGENPSIDDQLALEGTCGLCSVATSGMHASSSREKVQPPLAAASLANPRNVFIKSDVHFTAAGDWLCSAWLQVDRACMPLSERERQNPGTPDKQSDTRRVADPVAGADRLFEQNEQGEARDPVEVHYPAEK